MKRGCNHYSEFLTCTICFLLMTAILCESLVRNEGKERKRRGQQRLSCSVSSDTIVQRLCPNDTETRNTRAKELGCENITNHCKDSKDFVYHCVLNEWGNGSLEICAPSTKIIGQFCAEFNLGGAIVQEHHKTNRTCTSCPFVYNSTESFRYNECFKGLPSTPTGSTKQNKLPMSIDQWIGSLTKDVL
ncbi:uncharacterized protein LOC134273507 isoform X2 [Saccostrea cucullata]|uniref:uncharacterized protein LOC134273507 isoform X2 n=1 Tax=Saccostrea cuccullata TaxID=36930 RepID=UPI002ED21D07